MEWKDSSEQAEFRAKVQALIQERLPEYYKAKIAGEQRRGIGGGWQGDMHHGDAEAHAAAAAWSSVLREEGLAAPAWPKEYGGGGLSIMEQFIFNQEMAQAQAPPVGGSGASLLGPTVLIHGTDEQKRRYLPPTLTGEYLWAQGFSEPGAGSDLASLQTRAVRDGDEYVINGQKIWTSAAHQSNWIFGLFRTDPEAPKHRGISFFVMDMKTPGISVRPIITMGWEHETNETFYEDVRVPADQIIGEENRGWYVAMSLLDFERSNITTAVSLRKYMDQLLENLKTDEAKVQTQAGGLARARSMVAQHYIETEVLFNFGARIVSMQAAGGHPNHEASTSKIFSSELTQRLANTGTKVYGLYSNIWDGKDEYSPQNSLFTVEYVQSVVLTIFGGSNEIQRGIIATRGLGLPRG